jgi:hypothetical protein
LHGAGFTILWLYSYGTPAFVNFVPVPDLSLFLLTFPVSVWFSLMPSFVLSTFTAHFPCCYQLFPLTFPFANLLIAANIFCRPFLLLSTFSADLFRLLPTFSADLFLLLPTFSADLFFAANFFYRPFSFAANFICKPFLLLPTFTVDLF